MARTIEKEVELLLKRQGKDMKKTVENELYLVEKLEEELKRKKEEALAALKEKEEAKAKKLGLEILEHYEVSNFSELKSAIISAEAVLAEGNADEKAIESSAPETELDPALVNEIASWIPRLDAWEHSKWENKIDYNDFYPTANRIFKTLLDSLNHQKNSEGEIQNEGDFGQNIANEATDY